MSQLPRYESYKDSGVQWLGEIPSHWDVKRMKFVVANVGDKVDAKESDLRYFGLENIESFTGKLLDSVEIESEGIGHRFQKEDVLFGKLRPYLAKVFLAQEEGLSSTEALVFRSSEVIYPKFLSYYCLSQDFINEVNGTTFGSKMPRASWDDISSFRMVYPSLDEQKIIVGFLDKRLAQVDALIAKQEILLEKLAEQRVALISHAVTKGLNPDVEMKESGVEWLGKVPRSWDIANLRYFISCNSGDALESSKILRDADEFNYIPVIGGNGLLGFTENSNYKKECIAVGRVGALCGNVHFIDYESWINDNALLIKLISDKFNINYLVYLLRSRNLNELASKTAQPLLTGTQVKAEKVCIPLMSEQLEIVRYLDTNLEALDKLLETVNKTIQTLREYRSTLITQVVTGKIDVRNLKVN
ncbi:MULTISPECIES: restriction endonuclease subunit S [unclassified Acinetobacter]|uniref:restriction endonuclease subunit S n=1 Tax=unclassified Acinetobacter TaxID=196816 RepID=UPI0015D1A4D9|nr:MULTISPECIES: restriction endonuclease subunit S [unclassified Acinetobacter]